MTTLAIFGSGSLLIFNRWRRFALITLFACALYAQRVDYMAAFTLNKLFVGVYALMALAPGMYQDAATGRLVQSAVLLRVIQCTLILQYFAAGLAKGQGDWGHRRGLVQANYRNFAPPPIRPFTRPSVARHAT